MNPRSIKNLGLALLSLTWGVIVYAHFPLKANATVIKNVFSSALSVLSAVKPGVFLEYAGILFFIPALLAYCVLLGRTVLRLLKVELPAAQAFSSGFALGAGLLSLGVFMTGVAGLWYRSVLALFFVVTFAVLLAVHGGAVRSWFRLNIPVPRPGVLSLFLAGIIALFLALSFMSALGPETYYDSLVYHLALPKLYLLEHRIVPTPGNVYSGIPFLTEMLYGLAIGVAGDDAPRLVHFLFGIVCIAAFYGFTRHGFSRREVLLAALLFVSMPLVTLEFSRTWVELSGVLFTLLAVVHLLDAARCDNHSPLRKHLVLSALFTGFAMSTKYQAWVLLPVLATAAAVALGKKRADTAAVVRGTAVFVFLAVLVVSPWLVKNAFFYRDPVYPVFSVSEQDTWKLLQSDARRRVWAASRDAKEYAAHPWTLFMNGTLTGDLLGPLPLMLLPLLLFRKAYPSPRPAPVLLITASLWFLVSISTAMPRFFLPALALLSLLCGRAALAPGNPVLTAGALAMVFFVVSQNFCHAYVMAYDKGHWKVLTGAMSREEYLTHRHPGYVSPCFAAIHYVNTATPADAKILVAGDARGFHFLRRFRASSVMDEQEFPALVRDSASAGDLHSRMAREGYTHVLFNLAELRRLVNVPSYRVKEFSALYTDARMRSVFEKFSARYLVCEFVEDSSAQGGFRHAVLMKLRGPGDSPPPERNDCGKMVLDAVAPGSFDNHMDSPLRP